MKRDLLTLLDLTREEILYIVKEGERLKDLQKRGISHRFLEGRTIAMVFEKPSTRTRVSFEVGIAQLGATPVVLHAGEMQLGRGETVEDTSRVLSRYVDGIMIRAYSHQAVETLAKASTVPVINGLTDATHPCQILSDLLTIYEQKGSVEGMTVAYVGDGNNVAHSWILAAGRLDFSLRLGCPKGYEPDPEFLAKVPPERVKLFHDPLEAVAGADVVYTDVWASMGQEEEAQKRLRDFEGYQVTSELMSRAKEDAVFMHCLPAHRGQEVAAEVIDGPQSIVFDQAENRLHAQKAILAFLLLH
ncbi:MAG: ornithine carbamoyltransferase [Deltaproteobacteria bacterium]|nr:ornithine carbamoyltransferase [Deltaproteobacteria bacterium]